MQANSLLPVPYRLEIFETISSTHDEIMARARDGDPGFLWVTARQQTGGRGRMGRVWVSPPGNLYASLLLINPGTLADLPQLGFVAGLALYDAAAEISGVPEVFRIKWPNDLVAGDAKVSGLLLETSVAGAGRLACGIGFGINCQSSPQGLAYPATDLYTLTGRRIAPEEMLVVLSRHFADWLTIWDVGNGFGRVRLEWLSRAARLNQSIRVRLANREITGIFEGIDPTGRLLLRCEKECVTIDAGDVFLS